MDSGGDRVRAPQRQSREEDQYRSLLHKTEQAQQENSIDPSLEQGTTTTGLIVETLQKSFSDVSVRPLPRSPEGGRLRTVANNKYAVEGMVGSGAFCKVYQGSDLTNHEVVGIKLEDTRAQHALQLMHECRLYNILRGGKGVPNLRWFGQEQDYNVMVLDLLGPSLLHLFKICGQKFSLKTVIMLGYQMIDRVEYVHSQGLVHRDLKPDNFLMGCGGQGNQVFIIDFGLAKEYIDPVTRRHIPWRDRKSFTGTARYASRNQHRGIEHSRRDDIESLGYILMYFLRGNLPWQGHGQGQQQQRFTDPKLHEYMHNKVKMDTSVEHLCEGYPSQFADFLHHARGLGFYEQPDYSHLRSLFRDLFIQKKFQLDHVYDWTVSRPPPPPQQQQQRDASQAANGPAGSHIQQNRPSNVSYCPPLTNPEYRREVVAAN